MHLKVKVIENDTEENRVLNSLFVTPFREKFVEIGEEKFVLPIYFNENWEKINKLEVRESDVFITGHPKTGTTWLHEIVDLILNGTESRNTNAVRINQHLLLDFPIVYNMEKITSVNRQVPEGLNTQYFKQSRSFKTHLPWFLLPEQIRYGTKSPKILHILRGPKDTCVSFYHHSRNLDGYTGSFEQFCRLFLTGRLIHGSFFTTIKSYWDNRNKPNVLFVKYSDLKLEPYDTVRKIATFLEKPLTDYELKKLVECTTVDSLRNSIGKELDLYFTELSDTFSTCIKKINFVRKGVIGDYKSIMSVKLIEEFDRVTNKELEGTGIRFE